MTYLQEQLEPNVLRSFLNVAAKAIFAILRNPSEAAVRESPNDVEVQRYITAINTAQELRRDQFDSDDQWFAGLPAWVVEFGGPGRPGKDLDLGPEYRAKRIPLPHSASANVALITLSLPRQQQWTPGLAKPYIRVELPAVKLVGKLHNFLATLFTPGYIIKETGEVIRAQAKVKSVPGKVYYTQTDKTTAFECDTPFRLNSQVATLSAGFWSYSTSFQTSPVVYDFLKAFPGLAAAFGQGVFESEARRLVEALKSVTHGHAFVGGGPGSGKTTVALKIVKAIVSDIVNPKGGRVEPDPPADAANVPNDGQPAVVDDQSAVDDGQRSADDRVSESDKAAPGFEDATPGTRIVIGDGFVWDTASQLAADTEPSYSTEATANEWNVDTNQETNMTMPAAFQVSNTANTTVPAPPRNPRIAWTACHNKLVDDAVRRVIRECHDKLVVRVQPWMVEMKNLRRISDDVAPTPTDTSTNVVADRGLLTLVTHHDAYKQRTFEETSPTQVQGSLSEYARSMAFADPETWADVHAAWNQKRTDPDGFILNRPKHEEAFQGLMSAAIAKVDMACGTPVALLDFANHHHG